MLDRLIRRERLRCEDHEQGAARPHTSDRLRTDTPTSGSQRFAAVSRLIEAAFDVDRVLCTPISLLHSGESLTRTTPRTELPGRPLRQPVGSSKIVETKGRARLSTDVPMSPRTLDSLFSCPGRLVVCAGEAVGRSRPPHDEIGLPA